MRWTWAANHAQLYNITTLNKDHTSESTLNDSSKCYFRARLKTTFSITIKTSLFNLIWKVFFRSFSLSHSLLPIIHIAASLHRFGIVILWFGVSLSQFNLLSICLCRFDVCFLSLSLPQSSSSAVPVHF